MWRLFCLLLVSLTLFTKEIKNSSSQILYLFQQGQIETGVKLYQNEYTNKDHAISLLREMATALIKTGAKSANPSSFLAALYGLDIAQLNEELSIYALGIEHELIEIRHQTIHLLKSRAGDYVDELLLKGTASSDFFIRLESAYALAQRGSLPGLSLLMSMMKSLPLHMQNILPPLIAQFHETTQMNCLKNFLTHEHIAVRIAAILASGYKLQPSLLPRLMMIAKNGTSVEQEAAIHALSCLPYTEETATLLKTIAQGDNSTLMLLSAAALARFGDLSFQNKIVNLAKQKANLFAINQLSTLRDQTELLHQLLQDKNESIRVNAALALLEQNRIIPLPLIEEILIRNKTKYQRICSPAGTLNAWQYSTTKAKEDPFLQKDFSPFPLQEQILKKSKTISETFFLEIAHLLFEKNALDYTYIIIEELKKMDPLKVCPFIEKEMHTWRSTPLQGHLQTILYQMCPNTANKQKLYEYIITYKDIPVFPTFTKKKQSFQENRLDNNHPIHFLLPAILTVAESEEIDRIDLLLHLIQEGNPLNRPILGGVLLKAIE